MAIVLPHGVLFRGAAEGHIRQYLIEQLNCIDAVIGLPANIFYGTSIPTCILVIKNAVNIPITFCLLMRASILKGKNQNKLLPEHINKIVAAYKARVNEDKYCAVAAIECH